MCVPDPSGTVGPWLLLRLAARPIALNASRWSAALRQEWILDTRSACSRARCIALRKIAVAAIEPAGAPSLKAPGVAILGRGVVLRMRCTDRDQERKGNQAGGGRRPAHSITSSAA